MTTTTKMMAQGQPGIDTPLGLTMLWQGIVALGCFYAASLVPQVQNFFDAVPVVKYFIALVVVLIGVGSLASVALLWRVSNRGRLLAMAIDIVGAVAALLLLGHLLGLYAGIDSLAEALYLQKQWLIGIAVGYGLYWLSHRMEEGQTRFYVERLGIGIALLSLMILLLIAGAINAILTILGALIQPASLAAAVVGVLFTVVLIYLLRQGTRFGETSSEREAWEGWLFLMPNFISFMIFFAIPLLLSFYFSFTNYGEVRLDSADWVGLQNYGRILSVQFLTAPSPDAPVTDLLAQNFGEVTRVSLFGTTIVFAGRDPLFWQSMGTTFRYCIMLLLLSIPTALGLAMLLNAKIPGMKVFRALFFLPSIAAVVGVALVWQWLYNPVVGFINYTIAGIANLFGAADPAVQWLTDDSVLLLAVVIMAAWQVIGFNTVIFLAGLQGVNKEVMEAAYVDGANGWQRFWSMLLPLIAPTTFFVTVTTLIAGLQAFSEFYVLLGNSTSNARLTTVYYLYLKGFRDFNFGYASSTAWVLFAVIFAVTLLQFRLSSRAEAYSD